MFKTHQIPPLGTERGMSRSDRGEWVGGWGRRQNGKQHIKNNLPDLNHATLFRRKRLKFNRARHPELTLCLRQGVFSCENTRQFQLRWSCLLHVSGGGSRTGGEKSQKKARGDCLGLSFGFIVQKCHRTFKVADQYKQENGLK